MAAPRVLVCDHVEDVRTLLVEMLRLHSFEVVEVSNGHDALSSLLEGGFAAALLDLGLPDVSGFEVARRVRSADGSSRVKLIALTGYGAPADFERSRLCGFDLHLLKPVAITQVLAALASTRTLTS